MWFYAMFRWSAIAARLPGRTDNEIKNYWNTHIRKRLLRMGIDPVTHAPRLDLLDMSSILSSLLGNPSLLNLQGLLGSAQALMNPELLKLAATASLLSIKNDQNHDLASQNNTLQQILDGNFQLAQNQVAPKQEFGQFQTPIEATNMEGLSGNMAHLSCASSPQNSTLSYGENLDILQHNQVGLLGNQALVQSLNNNANQNLGYDSVLSSPNQLNSSSTYVNSSTEEERDSFCSDLFKFEIPESLDISDFM